MNKLLKPLYISLIPLAIAIQAPTVLAEDDTSFSFVGSLGIQNKRLSFDQTYKGPAAADNSYAEFTVYLPTANVSFTTAWKRIYLSLKYEATLTDTRTKVDETDRIGIFNDANLLTVQGSEIDVSRRDYSITLGYNVYRGLNIFIGYLDGETTLKPDAFFDRINGFYNKAYLNFDENLQGGYSPTYEQTYEETGPYIGASYSWHFVDVGTLSASYAYADMDGEYKDNALCVINSCSAFQWEGSSTGSSLGLTWTAPLGENSSYFFDVRRQIYEMDGDDKTGFFPNQSVETEETMDGITAGVQFYF